MRKIFGSVLFVLLFSITAAAEEKRFRFDLGYLGTGYKVLYDYPKDTRGLVSGGDFSANGIRLAGNFRLTGKVSLGARFENSWLLQPTFFSHDSQNSLSLPNMGEGTGHLRHWEVFGGINIPKVNHELQIGIAQQKQNRRWDFDYVLESNKRQFIRTFQSTSDIGPMIGISGERKFRGLP